MTPATDAVPTVPGLGTRRVLLVFVGLMITELLAPLDSAIFTTARPTVVGQPHGVVHQLWVARPRSRPNSPPPTSPTEKEQI